MAVSIHTAHAAAKAHATSAYALSLVLSVGAHFALFSWNPEFGIADVSFHSSELATIDIPPELVIPPPPQAIARPATPVVASTPIDDDITIAPTTFEANPIASLPPPPATAGRADTDVQSAPQFTPYTVRPELRNTEEVRAALVRAYPTILRESGIGGEVLLWVFIDETGTVQNAIVKGSAGYPGLDEAALRVAPQMLFTPAIYRDRRVHVWIELPLIFSTR